MSPRASSKSSARGKRVWLKVVINLEDISQRDVKFRSRASAYSRGLNVIRTRVGTMRQFAVCRHFYAKSSRESKNASSFMPWKRICRRRSPHVPLGRFLDFEEIRFSCRADDVNESAVLSTFVCCSIQPLEFKKKISIFFSLSYGKSASQNHDTPFESVLEKTDIRVISAERRVNSSRKNINLYIADISSVFYKDIVRILHIKL